MRLLLATALLASVACSSTSSTWLDPAFHRACATPIARTCSALAVLTPREVVPPSAMPTAPPLVRGDRIDVFEGPALLQRYAIDGAPPRFHATSDELLSPSIPFGAVATDGQALFGVDPETKLFATWDANDAPLASARLDAKGGTSSITGAVAAFGSLALVAGDDVVASSSPVKMRYFLYDDRGNVGWSDELPAAMPAAYGCGFALMSEDTLVTLPADGRAQATQDLAFASFGEPVPWPYDPHGVAMVSIEQTSCAAGLTVAFDDGRAPISNTFAGDCGAFFATVLSTSFGAVLDVGDREFLLLDEGGDAVGAPLSLTFQGDELTTKNVAAGSFIAVLANEETNQPYTMTNTETVIGCAP